MDDTLKTCETCRAQDDPNHDCRYCRKESKWEPRHIGPMLYVIKESYGEYEGYQEIIVAILGAPSTMNMTALRKQYIESRPVKIKANGEPYKNGRKDWSETYQDWLVKAKGFKRYPFLEVLDGDTD